VKLKAEAPGILAWLVRGCLEWQRKGDLKVVPQCIREATTEYRVETDPILSFLEECCVIDEAKTVRAGAFYSAFKEWSKGQKDVLSQTKFGRRMADKFTRAEDSKGKYYRGIGLRGSSNIIHLDLSD